MADFKENTTFDGAWKIIKQLGSGSFATVYEAMHLQDGQRYALKLEQEGDNVFSLLRMDEAVLRELKDRGCDRHFCRYHSSKNNAQGYKYVAMTLTGPSLHSLRFTLAQAQGSTTWNNFSMGTAMSVGIQMLEALEDLHSAGYLHRDVKPHNYTVEKGEGHRIYLVDFGISRAYANEGEMRFQNPPRGEGVPFRGTHRYASLTAHYEEEQSPRDDLEGWFYALYEITAGELPWKEDCGAPNSPVQIVAAKEKMREMSKKKKLVLDRCPTVYNEIYDYIASLTYYDKPDYERLYTLLREAMKRLHLRDERYDWEPMTATTPQATSSRPTIAR